MPSFLSPVFGAGAQLFDNQGRVLSGGKIYTYLGGTTTPTATFTDNTDLVTNPNPVILDSAGRVPTSIWIEEQQTTKFILTDANDNILGTWDNISGVNDITTFTFTTEWTNVAGTPSFISSTSFSIPGNLVSVFTVNRRMMISVTAGTVYAYVTASSFGAGVTTVTLQPDSTPIDSGISQVMVGLLNSSPPSVPQQYMAANARINVASAATTPIGAALSVNVNVTGAVTITAFDTVLAGIVRFVRFDAALTLTYNAASLILPGAANITTAAGDQAVFRSLGSGSWECLNYQIHGTFPYAKLVGNNAQTFLVSNATANDMALAADQRVLDQLSVTATQAAGDLTCGLNACLLRFRSATLTDGVSINRFVGSPLSLVIPNGALLGATSGVATRLVLVAIDNAGTIELAIINESADVSETTLISTTAISTGSDSINVFYSTTARSNVPFRVVGIIDATNTAGAWGNPALVQGAGGKEIVETEKYNLQIFTSSGTWTKPAWATGNEIVEVELWGGGGGGASGAAGPGGGGGGGYFTHKFIASDLGSTEPIVVGAGGAINVAGGNSTFGAAATLLTAFGGGKGGNTGVANSGGGGGGGGRGAGGNGAGTAGGVGGLGFSHGTAAVAGADGFDDAGGGGGNTTTAGGWANFGGGGGGGGSAGNGGGSFFGGGGGGGFTGTGGTSKWGGSGGTGAVGTAPGGGGAGGFAGANGRVRVQIIG